MSSEELFERDWYAVLDVSYDATNETIQRAARKKGLQYHPDKTDDPKDHELFLLVQKAKEILLDEKKRLEIDNKRKQQNARKEYDIEREKNMDSKRKRMRDELEEKLKSNSNQSNIDKNKIFKKNTAEDIEKLRRDGIAQVEKANNNSNRVNIKPIIHQIKVKWKKSRESHSDQTLYELFKIYGSIEDVQFVNDSINSAIITFTNEISVKNAIDAYLMSNDYRVTLVNHEKKKSSILTHEYNNNIYSKNNTVKNNNDNDKLYDNDIISSMKRSVARETLLNQIEKEDNNEKDDDVFKNNKSFKTNVPDIYANKTFTKDNLMKKEEEIFNKILIL